MKKYRVSLLIMGVLILTSPFHLKLERLILQHNLFSFFSYFMLATISILSIYSLLAALWNKDSRTFVQVIFVFVLLGYFLFFRKIFLNRLFFSEMFHIFEFFVWGFILHREGERNDYFFKMLLILFAALAFEAIQLILPGRVFDLKDLFFNLIFAFAGFFI